MLGPDPDAGPLTIARSRTGTVVRLSLTGELAFGTSDRLAPAVAAALAEPGVRMLLLDLAGLEFLDSVGMGAMVAATKRASAAGVTLAAVNPRGAPLSALQITRLDRVLVRADPEASEPGEQPG